MPRPARTRRPLLTAAWPLDRALVLALATGLSACGGATPDPRAPGAVVSCEEGDLAGCEARLADAIARGRDTRALALAYVEARGDADGDDALVAVVRGAGSMAASGGAATLAVVLPGGAPPPGGAVRSVTTPAVPTAGPALGPHGWLLVVAHATGAGHVVAIGPGGARTHALRRDPLRALVAGLPPVLVSTGEAPLEGDVAAVAAVTTAFEAASRFDYVAAAAASEVLGEVWATRPEGDSIRQRARFALQLLAAAGIVLEAEEADEDDAKTASPAPSSTVAARPARAPATPYETMLDVRTALDAREVYPPLRPQLTAALGPALGSMLDVWVGVDAASEVCAQAFLPAFDDDRHLAFAGWITTSLRPAGVAEEDARGRVPIETWFPRYAALHRTAAAQGLGWWAAGLLLSERGGTSGVSASASPVYEAVTDLGVKHVQALGALVESGGGRVGFASVATLALTGVREDPELAPRVALLAQRSTQTAMARAEDAGDVLVALIGGFSSAMAYPPELQMAQLNALQGAFTAQLRGQLAQQRGWGVAGLVALDAAYRVVAAQAPNLEGSATAIARALEDPSVEQPGLAALAVAASRYAALGAAGELGAPVLEKGKDGPKPARAEARRALRYALSRMGDGAAPSPGAALDDLTDLVDGSVATMTLTFTEAAETGGAGPVCASTGASPTTLRALGKLRDVRRRILAAGWFTAGDDAWSRRARVMVLATSDALDLGEGEGKEVVFAIDDARAARILREVLAGWAAPGIADAVVGAHALGRGMVAARPDPAVRARAVRELLVGLRTALTDESTGGVAGAGILDVLASDGIIAGLSADPSAALERDLAPALTREAERMAAAGDRSGTELLLLVIAGMSAASQEGVPPAALALADRTASRTRWVLVERDANARLHAGTPLDVPRLRATLGASIPPPCGRSTTDLVADVASAGAAFRAGRRDEARATLRTVVERLEKAPAVLPRSTFHYRENVGTRIFQATLGMTPSAGLLTASNTFQAGFGYQSVPVPRSAALRVTIDPTESLATAESSARFAVHAASIAAVYELLGGDPRMAERAGALAYARATRGAPQIAPDQPGIAQDAAPALLLAAQLFAEQGRGLLAGDLLALVRSTLAADIDDETMAGLQDATPLGLEGAKDAVAAGARARKTLAVLGDKHACTTAKVDLRAFETPRCEQYPLAIALRIADAVPRLPRLAVVDAKTCAHASLDRFFGKMDEGGYDPDALSRALEDRVGLGHGYDASVLLGRLRPTEHCSPAIVGIARALGANEGLPPATRADALLSGARCGHDRVADDVVAIDRLLMAAGDVDRTFEVLAWTAFGAAGSGDAAPLQKLVGQPGYHDRWMSRSARAAALAVAIDDAATTLAGAAPRVAPTEALVRTLCTSFPAQERAALCVSLDGLRKLDTPLADRKQIAEKTLESIAAMLSAGQAPAASP